MARILWQSEISVLHVIERLRAAGVIVDSGATIIDGSEDRQVVEHRVVMLHDKNEIAKALGVLAQAGVKAWAS